MLLMIWLKERNINFCGSNSNSCVIFSGSAQQSRFKLNYINKVQCNQELILIINKMVGSALIDSLSCWNTGFAFHCLLIKS